MSYKKGRRTRKLFFLLSGEHPTLPHAEARAILEAEGFYFKAIEELDQLLRLDCDPACSRKVILRASMTRACCLEIFSCPAEEEEILEKASDAPLHEYIKPGQSVRVRVKRVKSYGRELSISKLERDLGAIVLKAAEGLKVDLRKPDIDFLGVITEKRFFFGLKLSEAYKPGFSRRRPSRRPFFHPSAMMPKLARCMVNLARARPGELVLDPFCGTGSILIEAALIGCSALGLDISSRMTFGALLNARFVGVEIYGLSVADALKPPLKPNAVDRIITDPPYGRSASTTGLDVRDLYERFLYVLPELLPKRKTACLAAPSWLGLSEIASNAGLRPLEAFSVFVHSGLARELVVLQI